MRNLFDQYSQPENRLTHALVCALAEDGVLLRRFVRWVTGRKAPKGQLQIVEQQRPGETAPTETESAGLPDAWIFNEEGWALLIESKIAASVKAGQLRRHLRTAALRDFRNVTLLVITARGEKPRARVQAIARAWASLYTWLVREARHSEWAARCTSYMEILESELIEQEYLKEGGLTTFSGIPFESSGEYNYLEAKRLLKLATSELRKKSRLSRELGMDPEAVGRGAITGKEGAAVWDFLRLKQSRRSEAFTRYPHLTIGIDRARLLAIVAIPHRIKGEYRRRIVQLGQRGFSDLLEEITKRISRALRDDKGAAPWMDVVQRRFLTQRSSAIVDARLEFDLRTAYAISSRRGKREVKVQPQWMNATYDALAKKRSNIQLGIGASFPYSRSSSVGRPDILDRVADTWIACKPLLIAMGLK